MTALGFLYPGHSAEDDYPRIEQLLGSDIRLDVVHTDIGEDVRGTDALLRAGAADRLAAGVEELRMLGAEAVVWASAGASFVYGWEGAQEQVRSLAVSTGMPASSTSFGFVRALAELGVRRVAVGATYPDDVTALFAEFLTAGGAEVLGTHSTGTGTAAEAAAWDEQQVLDLARAADLPDAQAVLLPDGALHTALHLPALEKELGKPVLTANQVTVWEGLRLADRRVNAPTMGALFTREPIIQA